jgi:hypothetical protein
MMHTFSLGLPDCQILAIFWLSFRESFLPVLERAGF